MADIGVLCLLVGTAGASVSRRFSGLVYFGKISYGLYVFHQAALVLVMKLLVPSLVPHGHSVEGLVFGLPLTALIAHLSYRYFELPFLRLKARFEIIRSRPA